MCLDLSKGRSLGMYIYFPNSLNLKQRKCMDCVGRTDNLINSDPRNRSPVSFSIPYYTQLLILWKEKIAFDQGLNIFLQSSLNLLTSSWTSEFEWLMLYRGFHSPLVIQTTESLPTWPTTPPPWGHLCMPMCSWPRWWSRYVYSWFIYVFISLVFLLKNDHTLGF